MRFLPIGVMQQGGSDGIVIEDTLTWNQNTQYNGGANGYAGELIPAITSGESGDYLVSLIASSHAYDINLSDYNRITRLGYQTNGADDLRGCLEVRNATGSDPSTINLQNSSWSAYCHGIAHYWRLSGVNLSDAINVHSTIGENTGAITTSKAAMGRSVTTTVDGCLVIAYCAFIDAAAPPATIYSDNGWDTNATQINHIWSGASTHRNPSIVWSWKTMESAGATGDMYLSIASGSEDCFYGQIAFEPA